MKKNVFILFISFSLMAFAQVDALACGCVSLGEPLEQKIKWRVKESQAVFSGEVIGINKISKSLDIFIKIKVEESWKGILSEEVTITTDLSSCGYRFEIGTSYLVFANSSDKAVLTTGECSFNRKLYKADEELKILGKGKIPQPSIRLATKKIQNG